MGQPASLDLRIVIARTLACFMVVVLHTAGADFGQFGRGWWASNFYDSLTRSCVPLFFMTSGALLIHRHEPLGSFFKKRVLRVLPPLVFWTLVYGIYWDVFSVSVAHFLNLLVSNKMAAHLWYLYALFGLYLFVPFLSKIFRNSTVGERRVLLWIWAGASCLPFVQTLFRIPFDIVGTYGLSPFVGFFGFFFLGAQLFDRANGVMSASQIGALFAVFLAACAGIAWGTYQYSVYLNKPNEIFYQYLTPLVILCAFCLFKICAEWHWSLGWLEKPFIAIADCSLGIYGLHLLILLNVIEVAKRDYAWIHPWAMIPIEATVTFFISFAVIYLFKKLPLARYVA